LCEAIAAKLVKKFSAFYGSQNFISPQWCPYLDVVLRFAWSEDPERYTGVSVATARASHAGQVKGDDPDEREYPGPPGWRLGVWLTTSPRKKVNVKKTPEMPLRGLINRRPSDYKEKDLKYVTWHVRTQFDTGALISCCHSYNRMGLT
jgi:hypothetical protein